MTKPGDSQIKKTLHELAKEFPEKTYRELEKYRDADRQEEAIGIGHNHPPGEAFKKACTLGEMKKDRSYPDLTEVMAQENDKLKKRISSLLDELDTAKKNIKNLKWIKDHDYMFLIDENKKLHKEIKELKEGPENRINKMRKSGL